ncbi:unnamed protein product [Ceratitis capitata]|uniref:(Mediterranean fruit fly) hypothetical protein n=1 Tax=Ceratitis capitata TaxID=7213 RepID=A0A811UXB0_CERCA|nr:unnamed protein product [Ceratitis capitata]
MEVEYERILNASNHSKEDYFQVQAVNSNLRSQLAFIIEQLFADSIVSQQKLLNEITDNHVNLRHLVADLQSNTEEKLLLAKMQRELHRANQDLSDLRFDFDQLKQKCTTTERDTEYKQQELTEIKKNFQKERNAMDIKVRFLQKSVHTLREKYAKFTPLIFLTNFVFAYTKFVKKTLQKAEGDRKDELIHPSKSQSWLQ